MRRSPLRGLRLLMAHICSASALSSSSLAPCRSPSDELANITAWTVVQRSASQPTYDINVSVKISPCSASNSSNTSSSPTSRTAVCVVAGGSNGGNAAYWRWSKDGIGHSVSYLLKCWSFWVLQERQYGRVEKLLVDAIAHRKEWNSPWSQDLMTSMGARFEHHNQLSRYPCLLMWNCMSKPFEEGESFFPRPWFARELVRRFPAAMRPEMLPGFWIPEGAGEAALRLGVLNRRDERRWPEAACFLERLPQARPSGRLVAVASKADRSTSVVTKATSGPAPNVATAIYTHGMYRGEEWVNDGSTLVQQMLAIRRHHVIISPHGAQLANLAFASACTVLLEILPASFMIMCVSPTPLWLPSACTTSVALEPRAPCASPPMCFASRLSVSSEPGPRAHSQSRRNLIASALPNDRREYQQLLLEVGGRPFFIYRGSQPITDNLAALHDATERLARGDMKTADFARRFGIGSKELHVETVLGLLERLAKARHLRPLRSSDYL